MELIVISSPEDIKDEVSLINELFAAGMKRFHLRKPNIGLAKLYKLVDDINPVYRHQVVLHQHHEIAEAFGLERRHFPEALRSVQHDSFKPLKQSGLILSTSIHKLRSIEGLKDFEYVFFGPVFNSISKFGYTSQLPENLNLPTRALPPAIIALGGIDHSNIQRVKAMNFDGIAILGAIWNKGDAPVANFLSILECLNNDSETSIKTIKHD